MNLPNLQRGQALVESALALPILLLVLLATIDIWPAMADVIIAKNLSARAARAAAIALPPDDCNALVTNAIGTPELLFADLTYTNPCASGDYFAQGEPVTVTVSLDYHPGFWGGTWELNLSTTDFGR